MTLAIFLEMKTAQHGLGELYQSGKKSKLERLKVQRDLANSSRQTAGWY